MAGLHSEFFLLHSFHRIPTTFCIQRALRCLRQETTMSLKWIAQRLQMGTWTYVSNLLNEPPETQPQAQEVLPLCQ